MSVLIDFENIRALLLGHFPNGAFGGLALTLLLGVVSIVLATIMGLASGVLTAARIRIVSPVVSAGVQVQRALPLLLVLFSIWFVLPEFDINLDLRLTAVLALSIHGAAYISEIVRGSLRAVDAGQLEAGYASGLDYTQVMRHIVLPQAVRVAIPPLAGRYVVIMKGTSLAYLIGVIDVTGMGRLISARHLAPVPIYLSLLVLYFLVNRGLSGGMLYLERRMWPERAGEIAPSYYAE